MTGRADDPVFETRAELDAWSARTAKDAVAHQALGERTAVLDSLMVIHRVTLAHINLPFAGDR